MFGYFDTEPQQQAAYAEISGDLSAFNCIGAAFIKIVQKNGGTIAMDGVVPPNKWPMHIRDFPDDLRPIIQQIRKEAG